MNGVGQRFWKETYYSDQVHPSSPASGHVPVAPGPEVPRIALPRPGECPLLEADARTLILQRRSFRQYADQPYSLAELGWLCFATQGMVDPANRRLRTAPSAGARHAFETYLSVTNVTGVPRGAYLYLPTEHALVRYEGIAVSHEELAGALAQACLGQQFVGEGGATFIWTALPERMTARYGERGWRYLTLDAGHVCQNLYLACESVGAGCCAIAAYDDAACDRLLGLDSEREFVIYLAATGKRQATPRAVRPRASR